jgi:cholesterol oxidase
VDERAWQEVEEIPPAVIEAVEKYLDERTADELDPGLLTEQVPAPAITLLSRSALAVMPTPTCSFAVGSCQYPPGPFDATVASASYRRLNELIESGAPGTPTFAVLMGDQIYSDATAGLFDPAAQADRYVIPHEKLLRNTEVRRLLRRIPAYMMLDDHEIEDNWEPAFGEDGENSVALKAGRAAYLKYQRSQGPRNPVPKGRARCPLWYAEVVGGLPFFFADTRTERHGRAVGRLAAAKIMTDEQFKDLRDWIAQYRDDPRPKFIVSAAMFLPGRTRCAEPASSALHADAWEGFGYSRNELLATIARSEIANLVFLSGNEHHSSVTRIAVRDPDSATEVVCHSLHSSALYAPYVFANGRPEDLRERHVDETFEDAAGRTYRFTAATDFAPCADAFAVIDCFRDQHGWRLRYRFHQSDATWFGAFP